MTYALTLLLSVWFGGNTTPFNDTPQLISTIQTLEFLDCPDAPVTLSVLDPSIELPENNQIYLGESHPDATRGSVHVRLEHRIKFSCGNAVEYDVKVYLNNNSEALQVVPTTLLEKEKAKDKELALILDTKTSELSEIREFGLPYNTPECQGGQPAYHRIVWTVEDVCGSVRTCSYLVRLEDKQSPLLDCVGLSSVVVPGTQEVTLWAEDFFAQAIDDNTPKEELQFSFSSYDLVPSWHFTSSQLDTLSSLPLEIWSADTGNDWNCDGEIAWTERNMSSCLTHIVFDDPTDTADWPGFGWHVYGVVFNEHFLGIPGVRMPLKDPSGQEYWLNAHLVTTIHGAYNKIVRPPFTIIDPERNDSHRLGVSTLDLVQLTKHLLGIEILDSPYKIIAADANNDSNVNILDLIELRKLILNIQTELPQSESWRFVPMAYSFPDPVNPWPFPETIAFPDSSGYKFIGMKIGDLNHSWEDSREMQNDVLRYNPQNALRLMIENEEVNAGEEYAIEVTSDNFTDILGFQFTLQNDGLFLNNIAPGKLPGENLGFFNGKDHVTLSWFDVQGASGSSDDVLLTLHYTAQESGRLSDLLRITSLPTHAEAYLYGTEGDELVDVRLTYKSRSALSCPAPICKVLDTVVLSSNWTVIVKAEDLIAGSDKRCRTGDQEEDQRLYSFSGERYVPSRTISCFDLGANGSPHFILEVWEIAPGFDKNGDGEITWEERDKDYCNAFIVVEKADPYVCAEIQPPGEELMAGKRNVALHQNVPNPFSDETIIPFTLPEATAITVQVFDLTGKVVWETGGSFERGYHEIRLTSDDLNRSGVLYYRLQAGQTSAVRKMVLLD